MMQFERDSFTVPRPDFVYWHPTEDFVNELADYLRGKKVLETFAGNGYLAHCLSKKGISVTASSLLSGMDGHKNGLYHDIVQGDARHIVSTMGADYDVLVFCWPTVTPAVLDAAVLWGRDKPIVFIGEYTDYSRNILGGCATDEFFEAVTEVHEFEMYQGNLFEKACVYQLK